LNGHALEISDFEGLVSFLGAFWSVLIKEKELNVANEKLHIFALLIQKKGVVV
jgi:hypothetical protein